MCPSFRATGEEEHSTRGRARLLHEMLAGELVTDGWRSTEVRDALDLCLSCKGCRTDCPVGVDMATYKAEFLHHHYEGRRRPAAHYAMGWLPRWLRLVARTRTAWLVNSLASVRPLAAVAKRLGGIAAEREIPRVAGTTFTRAWRPGARKGVETPGRGRVFLWPDTFTEHLSPTVGLAAVRVLEAAGLDVLPVTAGKQVCCGLTYVSTGQLDRARAVMRRTLDAVSELPGTEDVPIVVLEPSCAAALRTDLPNCCRTTPSVPPLHRRPHLRRGPGTPGPRLDPARIDRPAAYQTHCHQHAVLGDTPTAASARQRA